MKFNEDMKESTVEVQIDTSAPVDKRNNGGGRTMGTRKHPVHFGRVPNEIRNQSEMSNDESGNISYN